MVDVDNAQRKWQIEKNLLDLPLGNDDIWLAVVRVASLSTGWLTEQDRNKIVDTYVKSCATRPNVPVANLVDEAGVCPARNNPLLSKLCFNYDFERRGEKRYNTAFAEWWENRQGLGPDINDPQFRSLGQWANYDFDKLLESQDLEYKTACPGSKNFRLTGLRANLLLNMAIGLTLPVTFVPSLGLSALSLTESMGGWDRSDLMVSMLRDKIFPLLGERELIKASASHLPFDLPTLVTASDTIPAAFPKVKQ